MLVALFTAVSTDRFIPASWEAKKKKISCYCASRPSSTLALTMTILADSIVFFKLFQVC